MATIAVRGAVTMTFEGLGSSNCSQEAAVARPFELSLPVLGL
jgi:hypothetical protein